MKFAAAALIAAVSAKTEPTGCKPGLKLEIYTDDECTQKVDTSTLPKEIKDVMEPSAKDLEKMTGKCFKTGTGHAVYVTCDVKEGVSYKTYTNEDCTGEADETMMFGWGKCMGQKGQYVQFKGAMALQAAAVALAAAVGTQF